MVQKETNKNKVCLSKFGNLTNARSSRNQHVNKLLTQAINAGCNTTSRRLKRTIKSKYEHRLLQAPTGGKNHCKTAEKAVKAALMYLTLNPEDFVHNHFEET